jgi:hypothetical protein
MVIVGISFDTRSSYGGMLKAYLPVGIVILNHIVMIRRPQNVSRHRHVFLIEQFLVNTGFLFICFQLFQPRYVVSRAYPIPGP